MCMSVLSLAKEKSKEKCELSFDNNNNNSNNNNNNNNNNNDINNEVDNLFCDWTDIEIGNKIEGPIQVPHMPIDIPAFLLRGVFSKEEANLLIKSIPFKGQGYMGPEEVRKLYRGRIVHRQVCYDEELSTLVSNRIKKFIPNELFGHSYLHISPEWRFLHYEIGGHQDCHTDGKEKRDGVNNCCSLLTIQMYLNDADVDFEGGEFIFIEPDSVTEKYTIKPRVGDAVIFLQESEHTLHKGNNVISGNKYCCRAMIEYTESKLSVTVPLDKTHGV